MSGCGWDDLSAAMHLSSMHGHCQHAALPARHVSVQQQAAVSSTDGLAVDTIPRVEGHKAMPCNMRSDILRPKVWKPCTGGMCCRAQGGRQAFHIQVMTALKRGVDPPSCRLGRNHTQQQVAKAPSLSPSQPGHSLGVGGVHVRDVEAQLGGHLGQQARGAPVQVVPRHDVVPCLGQAQHSRQRSHAACEGEASCSSLAHAQVWYQGFTFWGQRCSGTAAAAGTADVCVSAFAGSAEVGMRYVAGDAHVLGTSACSSMSSA